MTRRKRLVRALAIDAVLFLAAFLTVRWFVR